MKFSAAFKARVRGVYGDQFDHDLENGNAMLGRKLDDSSSGSIPLDTILGATSIEPLHHLARMKKEKLAVYSEYFDEVKNNQ